MAPRVATRPIRENDFSDVGKIGRRTGVTLPQGRLDVNGMEEITGIFSSPRKPSPLRKSTSIMNSVEDQNESDHRNGSHTPQTLSKKGSGLTPSQVRSVRKTIPPPRSASPRKSGIGGTARRSRAVDVLGHGRETRTISDNSDSVENLPHLTPTLKSSGARRFSPAKTPQTHDLTSTSSSSRTTKHVRSSVDRSVHPVVDLTEPQIDGDEETEIPVVMLATNMNEDGYVVPAVGDDDIENDGQISLPVPQDEDEEEVEPEEPPLSPPFDDEEADQTFEPEARSKPRSREPTVANSRRKRKSDVLEQEAEADAASSPAAKRAKRISDQSTKRKDKAPSPKVLSPVPTAPKSRGRPPLKTKDKNSKISKISTNQQGELEKIIEKVKARPGQKKSLYILRRETPANDNITHTRSGRVSVKPLAYWRNEKCVFGGSPGGASLQDGARFPLNSIKEIIRTEEVDGKTTKPSKKPSKRKGKHTTGSQPAAQDEDDSALQAEESAEETDEDHDDPDAEPWETEKGTFRGTVAVFDPQSQAPTDEEEDMDLAYAPAAIETREVKGSTFRYAKLISFKYFGSGIVDLPPGSTKKAKNSRIMHMSFFVATGRVTVTIGPLSGSENRFSVGKGGWWQVPRGNQYAIENELQKPARLFFSQACEPTLAADD